MQIIKNPARKDWPKLLERPPADNPELLKNVKIILEAVKRNGDEAVKSLTRKLDGADLKTFRVTAVELEEAATLLSEELKLAIQQAKTNIYKFHLEQVISERKIEIAPGIMCWRKCLPIDKIGFYIPGGTAPLFSTVLMLGVPAVIAGCRDIILCTPANEKGEVNPAILYTAKLLGITNIYKIGGAQAVAAMAYGTETVPMVYKIFGPGNRYVTTAKQLVQMDGTAIDMPAGPSEVCVVADDSADASYVAADLLAQAEHGKDSHVILISTSEKLVDNCVARIKDQLQNISRGGTAAEALENSKFIVVASMEKAIDIANEYAAEHLILNCRDADIVADGIKNAGSVFVGKFSPESAGDYASGPNHTLPTNGYARAYSGVSVDSYVKKITFQKLTRDGLNTLADTIIVMAKAEGLDAHAKAVQIRMADEKSQFEN